VGPPFGGTSDEEIARGLRLDHLSDRRPRPLEAGAFGACVGVAPEVRQPIKAKAGQLERHD
jgi:hypothetical protein